MPAGVTWTQYIAFSTAALVSMLAGSQMVHIHYKPLEDLQNYINKELENFPAHVQEKIKQELKEEGKTEKKETQKRRKIDVELRIQAREYIQWRRME